MWLMYGLVKNEISKFIANKKIIIFFLIFLVGTIFVAAGSADNYESKKRELSMNIIQSNESLEELKEDLELYEFMKNNDIAQVKEYYKEKMSELQSKKTFYTDERNQCQYKYYKYLYDNNLKIVSDINADSNIAMHNVFSVFSYLIIFLVIICVSESITSEYNEGGFKILFTKPFSRTKIVLGKFLANVLLITVITLSIEILLYFILGNIKEFNTLSYPEKVYPLFSKSNIVDKALNMKIKPELETSKIISQGELFVKCFLFQILFIAVLTALTILISLILKKGIISVFAVVLFAVINLTLGGYTAPNVTKFISCLFPFKYYDPLKIINHEIIMDTGAIYLNDFFMFLIPLVWIVVSLRIVL